MTNTVKLSALVRNYLAAMVQEINEADQDSADFALLARKAMFEDRPLSAESYQSSAYSWSKKALELRVQYIEEKNAMAHFLD